MTGEYSDTTDYYDGERIEYDNNEAMPFIPVSAREGARIRAINYNDLTLHNHMRLAKNVIYAAKMLRLPWDTQGRFMYMVAPTLPVFHGAVVVAVQCIPGPVRWYTNAPASIDGSLVDDSDGFLDCDTSDKLVAPYDGIYRVDANLMAADAGSAGYKSISLSGGDTFGSNGGAGDVIGAISGVYVSAGKRVDLNVSMTRYLNAGEWVQLSASGFDSLTTSFTATMSIQWLGMPAHGRYGTAAFCMGNLQYGCGSGSGGGGGGGGGTPSCVDGGCDGVPNLMATITSKAGCFTDFPDTIEYECDEPGAAGTGHLWRQMPDTGFEACSRFWNFNTHYISQGPGIRPQWQHLSGYATTMADIGYTCAPVAFVFHVNDGAGNSCVVTVTEM